jgi:hypothetical protein
MSSVVPLIPITLDKPRHLRLDNRALFHAEVELSRIWNKKQNILSILHRQQRPDHDGRLGHPYGKVYSMKTPR